MKPLRVGLIGYGGIGRVHAMALRDIPFLYGLPADAVQIVGVATTRPETAQKAAQEIGCDFWTADYHELLAHPEIDLVDVTVPNYAHAEIVIAAAQAGKHIYCEKPLAMNVAEGRRMVAAAEQAAASFVFHPNPGGDRLYVHAESAVVQAQAVDATGRMAVLPLLSSNSLNTQALVPGVWAVRILFADGRSLTDRFVRE